MPEFIKDPIKHFNEEAQKTGNPIIEPTSQFVKGTTITGKEADDYRLASDKYGEFNFTQIKPKKFLDTRDKSNNELLSALAIVAVIIICLTLLLKTKHN